MEEDAAGRGRRELLERRMFHLKRFDSAEYILASGQKSRYLREVEKAEEYEKKHRLTHEHFELHGHEERDEVWSPSSADSASKKTHPLRNAIVIDPEQQALHTEELVQHEAGRRALLRRKLAHSRRFDSGDYFLHKPSDEDVVAQSTLRVHVKPGKLGINRREGEGEKVASADQGASAQSPRSPCQTSISPLSARSPGSLGVLPSRFIRKKIAHKRWDSGDYNALRCPESPKEVVAPDLDLMSVSSAEHTDAESKIEDSLCSNDSSELSFCTRSPKPSGLRTSLSSPLKTDQLSKESTVKNKLRVQTAAKKHLEAHNRGVQRFDSADYFRGLSPPSQNFKNGWLDVAKSPPPKKKAGKSSLGENTLAQRNLRAAKLERKKSQREQDFNVL